MRKLRDDSTWNQLTPEQRETLESWLFDENLGYAKTQERVLKEFQLEATVASVGRYYRRRARERQVAELAVAQIAASELNDLPGSTDSLRIAAVKLVGKAALKLAGEQPEQLGQLTALTRLLLENEDTEIRRARLRLAEKCYDHEAMAAAQKDMPQLRSYLRMMAADKSLSPEERIKRLKATLFGEDQAKSGEEPDKSNSNE